MANTLRNSTSHPIRVDWLPLPWWGKVGLTFAPGKKQTSAAALRCPPGLPTMGTGLLRGLPWDWSSTRSAGASIHGGSVYGHRLATLRDGQSTPCRLLSAHQEDGGIGLRASHASARNAGSQPFFSVPVTHACAPRPRDAPCYFRVETGRTPTPILRRPAVRLDHTGVHPPRGCTRSSPSVRDGVATVECPSPGTRSAQARWHGWTCTAGYRSSTLWMHDRVARRPAHAVHTPSDFS